MWPDEPLHVFIMNINLLKTAVVVFFLLGFVVSCSKTESDNLSDLPGSHPDFLHTYIDGKKISLQRVDGKFYVAFFSKDEGILKTELSRAGLEQPWSPSAKWKDYSHLTDMTGFGAEKFVDFQTDIIWGKYQLAATALSHTFYWAPWYKMENGIEIVPSEIFTAILKPQTTLEHVEKLAKENHVEMIGWFKNFPSNWYLLTCTNYSVGNSFEMAVLFYESGLFEDVFADTIGSIIANP